MKIILIFNLRNKVKLVYKNFIKKKNHLHNMNKILLIGPQVLEKKCLLIFIIIIIIVMKLLNK